MLAARAAGLAAAARVRVPARVFSPYVAQAGSACRADAGGRAPTAFNRAG